MGDEPWTRIDPLMPGHYSFCAVPAAASTSSTTSGSEGGRVVLEPCRKLAHAMICRSKRAPVMNKAASEVIVRDMPVPPGRAGPARPPQGLEHGQDRPQPRPAGPGWRVEGVDGAGQTDGRVRAHRLADRRRVPPALLGRPGHRRRSSRKATDMGARSAIRSRSESADLTKVWRFSARL
jgi:hypothetical protein